MGRVRLAELVVEVLHNEGTATSPDWSVGSGYVVGKGVVLTAAHNVGNGELLVRWRGSDEQPATVRLAGDEETLDLALLEVPNLVVHVPQQRFGMVSRERPALVKGCWAVGFPRFKERPGDPKPRRLSVQVNGEIPTGENLGAELLTLRVTSAPRPLPQSIAESEWAGMSGAVVFADDVLIGVVTEHHLPEGDSALTLVPVTAITQRPDRDAWWKLLGVDRKQLVQLPRPVASNVPNALKQSMEAARAHLIIAVQQQWKKEAESRSFNLLEEDFMPVPWETAYIDSSGQVFLEGSEPGSLSGRVDDVSVMASWFRATPRQRLVLAGDPSSGKTTLAIRLLLELVSDLPENSPVPVFFSVGSWNPAETPRINDWLADRLNRDYPGLRASGGDVATMLCETHQILPILDSLDEAPEELRPAIIIAINETLASDCGLVLTSRSEELGKAVCESSRILGADVRRARPLSDIDAVRYLQRRLPELSNESWAKVLRALNGQQGRLLKDVITSPLGLWLVLCVYVYGWSGKLDPANLVDGKFTDSESLKAHLFDHLIPAMIHSRPPADKKYSTRAEKASRPRYKYEPDDIRRWLAIIASDLAQSGRPDWLWWELAARTFARRPLQMIMFRLCVGISGIIFFWAVAHILLRVSSLSSIGAAVVSGSAVAFLPSVQREPIHINTNLRPRVGTIIARAGILGASAFIALTLIEAVGYTFGYWSALSQRLGHWAKLDGGTIANTLWKVAYTDSGVRAVEAILFALAMVVLTSLLDPTNPARRSWTPLASYREACILCAILVTQSIVISLLIELFAYGDDFTLAISLVLPASALIILPLPLFVYWIALLIRALKGDAQRLPWHLSILLDDAYRLGLLRTVGPAYQFRHAELQHYLAPRPGAACGAPTTSTTG